jgi:hypothetical protein
MMMMMMRELRWKVNKPTVFIWLNPIKQIKISKFFQRWCGMLRHMLREFECEYECYFNQGKKGARWCLMKRSLDDWCGKIYYSVALEKHQQWIQSDGRIFWSWKFVLVYPSCFSHKNTIKITMYPIFIIDGLMIFNPGVECRMLTIVN